MANDEDRARFDVTASLRRSFGPPLDDELDSVIGRALEAVDADAPPSPWHGVRPLLVAAAGLLVAATVGSALFRGGETARDVATLEDWIASYERARLVSQAAEDPAGPEPLDVCVCVPGCVGFEQNCLEELAASVTLLPSAEVTVVGSCCGDEGACVRLVARCGDGTLCLFVVDREHAPAVRADRTPDGVRVRRRDLGTVAAYEVSRLDEARLLPHLAVH